MGVLSSVVDTILKLHGVAAYALVGGLVFAEAALFVGFVLPGETAVILGGVLAHQHKVSLPVIATVAVLAATSTARSSSAQRRRAGLLRLRQVADPLLRNPEP